ncbi:MAG: hypothetical protein LBV68_04400, partial [Spirochaetaceae bacterium]|nr:hypothetical protein [Spirochaetaceae bacterium]
MNEYTWLDAPYFNIIDNILSIQSYFITQAWFIARIVVFLAIGMAAINYAMNGQGLKSSLTKLIMAFVVFTIIINFYPQ